MNVLDIQKALKKQGYDPGPLDGVWGRRTIAAVMQFQKARGLEVDGIVGPVTAAALASESGMPKSKAETVPLVWYEEARRQLGTAEKPGPVSNPKILQWAGDLGIRYGGDDIPWCGLFVAHCVGSTLPAEPLPNNPLGARNWGKFGLECKPLLGAILVFWRESKNGSKGHVGFYHGEDSSAYHVLGGNQSDKVSIARINKDRLLGARRPATAPALTGAPVLRTRSGELSTDES